MEMEDDTMVFSSLKSFQSFISMPDSQTQRSAAARAPLQSHYLKSMELQEAADRLGVRGLLLQSDQEKRQMETSHKRARIELEHTAGASQAKLEREVERNQDLLGRIRRLEEREAESARSQSEQEEALRALRSERHALDRKDDADAHLVVSGLKDEIRELRMQLQNLESCINTHTLEKQALQDTLDLQNRKYQEMSQRCQSLQAAQSSCTDHEMKIKALECRLLLQEQDNVIVQNMRSEVARVTDMDKELRHLRQENAYLRERKESCGLLQEEVEGLRRKVERMEKIKEELVAMELEKEKVGQSLQAWENMGASTGLNIRKPEDLSREIIQIQQREITLKQENYTLTSSLRSAERSLAGHQGELASQSSRAQEDQRKKENQEALVRRLQRRLLLLTKERDGMRGILDSYDGELSSDYSPQLSRRLREAEDGLAKTHTLCLELEGQVTKAQEESLSLKQQLHTVEMEVDTLKKQAVVNPAVTSDEVRALRQKVEELEADRQRLEDQKNNLEMRLERHSLQGDYDPVRTKVLHFSANPTSAAKAQRQEEVEALRQEVTRLREHLASPAQDVSLPAGISLPPSQEVLELRGQMQSLELKNQRLKEVFQTKILEFRTVCYVLTGYQVDLTTQGQYRLSSVYAEHMDDCLLFKASGGAVGSGSMQLMETAFSRTLGDMVELHLQHQKSIPAFLSALTLELFSRQTTM